MLKINKNVIAFKHSKMRKIVLKTFEKIALLEKLLYRYEKS